jgi:D-alanyl-D-alanine dipeptidase
MNLEQTLRELSIDPDYVNLRALDSVVIQLKYATTENFMGKNVYGEFREALLHRLAAEKLVRAAASLNRLRPHWKFLVFDALRPRSVQRLLWAHVEGTPEEAYVANPERGSVHGYGCAIDLTLLNEEGVEVDMGSAFDTFHALSQPKLEDEFLQSGEISHTQVENRHVLRECMTGAGFIQLPHEWWHFDAFTRDFINQNFRMIE